MFAKYTRNDMRIRAMLKDQHVHITQNRLAIYKLFITSKSSLSGSAIIKLSEVPLDRISVYRTLRYFLNKGMLQVIPNSKGDARYILSNTCNEVVNGKNGTKHVYFVCTSCQLTEVIVQPVNIPLDTLTKNHIANCKIILEGLCSDCNK